MGQDTLVAVNLPGGWQLIEALIEHGFKVDVAFWAKESDREKWWLYLASPYVDEHGVRESYRLINDVVSATPECGMDQFSIGVLETGNTMAKAAAELAKPRYATGPLAKPNQKPYRGITRFGDGSLGGFYVDGALIYPPWEPGLNPVG